MMNTIHEVVDLLSGALGFGILTVFIFSISLSVASLTTPILAIFFFGTQVFLPALKMRPSDFIAALVVILVTVAVLSVYAVHCISGSVGSGLSCRDLTELKLVSMAACGFIPAMIFSLRNQASRPYAISFLLPVWLAILFSSGYVAYRAITEF